MTLIAKIQAILPQVTKLVDAEIQWNETESNYGYLKIEAKDSFDDISLRTHCEPEDAIWYRDLQDNYYEGFNVGVRNTIKILIEHPEFLDQLKELSNV